MHGGASRRARPTLAATVAAGCFLVLLSAVHQQQQLGFAHVIVRLKSSFVLVAPAAEAVARARHKARCILWVAQPELRAALSANVQPAILEEVAARPAAVCLQSFVSIESWVQEHVLQD